MNIYEYFVKQYCEINDEHIIIDFEDFEDFYTCNELINHPNNGGLIEYNDKCDFNTVNIINDVHRLDEIRALNIISTIFKKKIWIYNYPCVFKLKNEENIIYFDSFPSIESPNPEPSTLKPATLPHRNFEPKHFDSVQVSLADFL